MDLNKLKRAAGFGLQLKSEARKLAYLALLLSLIFCQACSSLKSSESNATSSQSVDQQSAQQEEADSAEFAEFDLPEPEHNPDPFEPMNRAVFAFNNSLDKAIVKPVAKGYKKVTPDIVELGVTNFFSNLKEINNLVNNALQWKWKKAGNSAGRFLLNSTIGLAGVVDVASPAGLKKLDDESFGQTLSYWGVKQGPYLVLPLLGPTTILDVGTKPLEWELDPIMQIDDAKLRYALKGLELLDLRARLLAADDLVSGDRYTFIREAYLQRREYLVNDGEVVDDFGGDFEDFEGDF